jgi:hypothetical protein
MYVAISIWAQTPAGAIHVAPYIQAPLNPRGAPWSGKLFRHQRKSTAKIDPPPETVVLKKLFAGKRRSYLAVSQVNIIKLKFVQRYLKIRLR